MGVGQTGVFTKYKSEPYHRGKVEIFGTDTEHHGYLGKLKSAQNMASLRSNEGSFIQKLDFERAKAKDHFRGQYNTEEGRYSVH